MATLTTSRGYRYPDGNEPPALDVLLGHLAQDVDADIAANIGAAWTPYTPALSNVTLGNGTLACAYRKIGRTVHVRGLLTLGSTSAVSATVGIATPVVPAAGQVNAAQVAPVGAALLRDASAGGTIRISATTGLDTTGANFIFHAAQVASYAAATTVNNTFPFTWAVGDILGFSATYESAS